MADINYGMGQYRRNTGVSYLKSLKLNNNSESSNYDNSSISYYEIGNVFEYRDVAIDLSNTSSNNIFYGNDYFLQLDIPRNKQYSLTINLKLCASNSENTGIDTTKYQQLKQIIIDPVSVSSDIYKDIILFSYKEETNSEDIDSVCFLEDLPENIVINSGDNGVITFSTTDNNIVISNIIKNNTVYQYKNNDILNYYYVKDINNIYQIDTTKKKIYTLEKEWENLGNTNDETSFFHLDFAFSPKYNLSGGYKYLLLEIDRNSVENQTIQYIADNETYYGTSLDASKILYSLYSVTNLIGNTEGSEILTESNNLNHIGVWAHPEQILIINGEEIKVGRSGFYELNDYKITRLGVINSNEVDNSNFTIDYEYQVSN